MPKYFIVYECLNFEEVMPKRRNLLVNKISSMQVAKPWLTANVLNGSHRCSRQSSMLLIFPDWNSLSKRSCQQLPSRESCINDSQRGRVSASARWDNRWAFWWWRCCKAQGEPGELQEMKCPRKPWNELLIFHRGYIRVLKHRILEIRLFLFS